MIALMTASDAENFYNQNTTHRYSNPGSLMIAMKKASDKDGSFAWVDPKTKRNVTDRERILAFIEWRRNRPPSRHNRKTITSRTVSRQHGRPVGKAASQKPQGKLKPPEGGEIRINPATGQMYILLPSVTYNEAIRMF